MNQKFENYFSKGKKFATYNAAASSWLREKSKHQHKSHYDTLV